MFILKYAQQLQVGPNGNKHMQKSAWPEGLENQGDF
jgi:hypothetical protein